MFRVVLALLMAGCFGVTAHAQTFKEKPKKIVVSDPKDLKDDKDYAIQGEYAGTILDRGNTGKKDQLGVQVIAKGDSKFDLKVYSGGLPGAGWDGKSPLLGVAVRTGDGARLDPTTPDGKEKLGILNMGTDKMIFTYMNGKVDAGLSKVDRKSPTMGEKSPEGADVLFAKPGDESNWTGGKIIELSDGQFLNRGIRTKKQYGSFRAHIEFRLPWMPGSTGQGRGNSGFYLQDRYELQILDSFGLKGENNECGGIYTLHKPSVNMCLPPMVWQTYDIDFTAAEFDGDKKTKPARVTILHNGVKIQDDVELKNSTGGGIAESAKPGAIQLQDHGDPVVFRNAWIVAKK